MARAFFSAAVIALAVTAVQANACEDARESCMGVDASLPEERSDQQFGFSVALELSDRSQTILSDQGEEIIVAASYYGNPTPAGEEHGDDVGRIDLGTEEAQVPAETGNIEITGVAIDTGSLKWVEGEVMVNVNVYSARLSNDDNLLVCDFIDGPFSAVSSSPVTLRCALIEEDMESELKP